ncbi:hypothetical protein Tco_0980081, partial [Tanacetum coccineum]
MASGGEATSAVASHHRHHTVAKAVVKPRQLWRAITATILLSLKEATFKFQAQEVNKGSMHKLNQIEASTLCISAENCLKVKKLLSREHDGRKVGARCSKPKSNGQIHNEMLKDRMNHERKSLKNDSSSFKGKVVINIEKTQEDSDQCSLQEIQKEDMCSYEDKVNGLSSHLESIGLD